MEAFCLLSGTYIEAAVSSNIHCPEPVGDEVRCGSSCAPRVQLNYSSKFHKKGSLRGTEIEELLKQDRRNCEADGFQEEAVKVLAVPL